jgi:OOP family OmpA-OmpF porin
MFHVIKNKALSLLVVMGMILPLSFLFPQGVVSQEETPRVLQKKYKRLARKYETKGEPYNAIAYYNKYFAVHGDDDKAVYRLANLYYSTRNYQLAKCFYDSLALRNTKRFFKAYYYNGLVCMNLEEYQEAIESFEIFRKKMKGKRDPDHLRRQLQSLIQKAEWAMLRTDSLADVAVVNIGQSVNKPHIEFSPFPVDETHLIYGSLFEDTSSFTGNRRQLYIAELGHDGWRSIGKLPGPMNNPEYHTGNAALSPDGERIYFTRSRKNWRDKMICEIYVSELVNGEWKDPRKLPYPINDENYTSTQPSVGKNIRTGGDILYYVSDRKGTRGELDIWYSIYDPKTGNYSEPRNAGPKINTLGNECCPFYDNSSRVLYFSSTNRIGFGGYDIQKSTGSERKWTETIPLPRPINTSYDDTYFSVISGTENGFFTSNRPGSYTMENGSCCDDIFYYHFNKCTRLNLEGKVISRVDYDVYDVLNEKYKLDLAYPKDSVPAKEIPVQLYLKQPGNEEILVAQTTTDAAGKYSFFVELGKEYKLVVKNFGFFDKVYSISAKGVKCSEVIDAGIAQINVLPKITARFNIYYEHDKSRLTKNARTTIDTLLLPVFDLFPNAIIEIGSHTDNTGTDVYNDKLSQGRSENVVKYLIQKGISSERLVAKGYGEKQPIAPNENPDGTDNPQGRQLNRRTELKIVGEINTFYLDE